jgi:hypothetical protein
MTIDSPVLWLWILLTWQNRHYSLPMFLPTTSLRAYTAWSLGWLCSKLKNHRNYYQNLHVQPDEPDKVIQSCYRMLMQELIAHWIDAMAILFDWLISVSRNTSEARNATIPAASAAVVIGGRFMSHPLGNKLAKM